MKIKEYYKENPYIHYSNCHEDTAFVLSQIQNHPKRILCIASALDNALAMLLLRPNEIVVIDYNDAQVYLCRLKQCGIKHLEYCQFLVLLGVADGDSLRCYEQIKMHLDKETRQYFDEHLELISDVKLVNCGRFEYYFSVFKNKVLPLIHSEKTIQEFMSAPTISRQKEFYRKRFNNRRFRWMFKLFFSEAVMKRVGRDKEFFKYNKGSLSRLLKNKFEICIENNLNAENPYLQYVIFNTFSTLPMYLIEENFEIIKKNIDKVTVKKASFEEAVQEEGVFDFMYLSDIFEYMDGCLMERMTDAVASALSEGGEVLLFNMMNPRRLGAPLTEIEIDQVHNQTFYYTKCYLYRK